ncbi:unnamed protein product [marine sediment metagenome]|uniref:Uncharacterized protein n=1 Tax=marine sediment metagenome TaxID=412755 RepID=X1BD31_9ZZZZ
MTTTKQPTLSAVDKKFWKESAELSTKGRFIQFTDGEPLILEIHEWTIHQIDTNWGKKPAVKTINDKFLKLESKRLRYALTDFVGKPIKLVITRNDSQPNSQNTWYHVEEHGK